MTLLDAETVRRYESFLASRPGQYAVAALKRLFAAATATWPRRGRSLLDVGCKAGALFEFFHEQGFDITGVDDSPAMLAAARKLGPPGLELHLADPGHLPFDDNSFDYAALMGVLEYADDPRAVLLEMRRVTRRGLVIGLYNAASAHALEHKFVQERAGSRWHTPWDAARLVRQSLGLTPSCLRCTLWGPALGLPFTRGVWSWGSGGLADRVNSWISPIPLGAYCVIRVDFPAQRGMTGLLSPAMG